MVLSALYQNNVLNGVCTCMYVSICSAYHGHLTLLRQISSHKLAAQGAGSQSASAPHVSIVSQQESAIHR